ncbi:hypothetical protein JR316_0002866 [Psilocybe cubensis]|uniref:Uncharacterized protein n=2 Tax=Psilocybe cubensis TaxID=181762 RepID=A0ACB8H5X7_PSICU|nr:hypothetical protein JR316_0002866 [Psilocybe cubensis]KAH9483400.1 hypothetical protein JR316_0002866 [Psilocybe cubensis]
MDYLGFLLSVQALPLTTQFEGPDAGVIQEAYAHCCAMEASAGEEKKLFMYARVLGYMILEAPSTSGSLFIAREIIEWRKNKWDLNLLAEFYVHYIFGAFTRRRNEFTDERVYYSFEEEDLYGTPDPYPRGENSARRTVLHRDGFSCKITHIPDEQCFPLMTPAERKQVLGGRPYHHQDLILLCSIIPPSIDWNFDLSAYGFHTTECSKTLGDLLYGFSGIPVATDLSGDMVYDMSNSIALAYVTREHFNVLALWLEEVPDKPNTYLAQAYCEGLVDDDPPVITFTTPSNINIPLPNSKYIRLHASLARIAHLSGVYRYLDNLPMFVETLDSEGKSGDILMARLSRAVLSGCKCVTWIDVDDDDSK